MADFIWGKGGKITTPEQAARERAIAQALLGQSQTKASNWGEGLARVAQALSGTSINNRVGEQENQYLQDATATFNGISSASPQADIIAALGNPWLNDDQSSVAKALLNSQLEQADPLYKAKLAAAEAEAAGGGVEYFGSTLPWQDAQGNLQYYQLRKGEGLPQLPPGARWLEPTSTVNTGTAQTIIGRNTGGVQGAVPIENMQAEKDKTVGTGLGNISVDVINAGRSARSNNAKLDILEQTIDRAPQGAAGALVQAAGSFGIPLEGLDDVQAAQAIINQLVPLQRLPGSGTMSDADLALFKQSLPAIINQPGGNKKIIATLRSINDYVEKAGDIELELATKQITPQEADRRYRNLANPLQNFNAATGSAPSNPNAVVVDGFSIEAVD